MKKIRVNNKIRAEEVLVITDKGVQLGVMPTLKAIEEAENVGLDLVEVAPKAKPPVCRLMDYGKLKYDQKKKDQSSKKKQHVIKIKEVRFRPRISQNDFDTKINRAKKFLEQGCHLKITVMFRGREMARQDLGEDLVKRIYDALDGFAQVEKRAEMQGNRFSILMKPV